MNIYYKTVDENGLYGVGFCDRSIIVKKIGQLEDSGLNVRMITKQEFNDLCKEVKMEG